MRVNGKYCTEQQQSEDEAATGEEAGGAVGDGGRTVVDNWQVEGKALQ